ncbi:MAG TPA: peptide chain release factor N(5)-glutamine methyltransferase [Anaerolineales bacterium]|nr:peptide chain release factor N(5)-glutamine methyltransferase [Anaerolineales bacterium]
MSLLYSGDKKLAFLRMEITLQEILIQLTQRLGPLSETAVLDAQVLVAHHLGKSRTWVMSHPEALIYETQYKEILESTHRLEKGELLPYVLGHWEFYGLDFDLTQDVLIPRPETELLVERAIRWLSIHPNQHRVVDVGTGSGCIGIAIAKNVPDVQVVMADISLAALLIARRNADKHGILDRSVFMQADLLAGLPGPFDLICANLPYIPSQELNQLRVAQSEPRLSLDGGSKGIETISRLIEETKGRLIAGGLLLLEIEASQGIALNELAFSEFPQSNVHLLQDLAGKDRCLEIERPNRIVHLCTPLEWQNHREGEDFREPSLDQEGFIHCSQPEQILEVANRYYQGNLEMVVLWINPEKLLSKIRWELAGSSYYPHVYGPINPEAIEATTPLQIGRDGIYRDIFS